MHHRHLHVHQEYVERSRLGLRGQCHINRLASVIDDRHLGSTLAQERADQQLIVGTVLGQQQSSRQFRVI
jgi:hypothetical protein